MVWGEGGLGVLVCWSCCFDVWSGGFGVTGWFRWCCVMLDKLV